MPLLPGFSGDVCGESGVNIRALIHWQYNSIWKGKNSIIAQLQANGVEDVRQYISFHGLRTHSQLNGLPISELIYVHAKLLIADDDVVICGSANINDRSMLGTRDSEMAIVIRDEEYRHSKMNGKVYKSGMFAGTLRRALFEEHLGHADSKVWSTINVDDPISDSTASLLKKVLFNYFTFNDRPTGFWNDVWLRISMANTEIYEKVFKCVPTNEVRSMKAYSAYRNAPSLTQTCPSRAIQQLQSIQVIIWDD